jgi:hypothetical protein
MTATAAPPSLAALLAPRAPRDTRIRLHLQRHEHQQLTELAHLAGVPVATLGHRLLSAGLQRLVEEQAAAVLHQQEAA